MAFLIYKIHAYFRAISADRRGIEPDRYVFQVPEHEEGPLGPLRLTDRRGNIRKEASIQFREETEIINDNSPNMDQHLTRRHRPSVLTRLFSKRKKDSQESSLVKGSTSTDDSNTPKASVKYTSVFFSSILLRYFYILLDGQSWINC